LALVFFQAPDLPELMIGAVPEAFLRYMFRALTAAPAPSRSRWQEYLRAFTLPGTIRAGLELSGCGDAGDFEDDERDLGLKVRCPVLAIWGEHGKMHTLFGSGELAREAQDVWRPRIGMRPFHPRGGARRGCWPTCGD
jgi:haloacetate dehalogenase